MDDARPSKRIRTAAATDTPSGWSELLPEIAGGILSRLTSFADRARFHCACRQWRLAAEQQEPLLPPAFPWLATSDLGVFVSLPNGAHHLLPTPDAVAGAAHPRAAEAFDGWLLFRPQRAGGDYDDYCILVNPFSKATLKLPALDGNMEKLLVVPQSSSNGGRPLVAAITYSHSLLFCRPGARSWSERRPPAGAGTRWVKDMALHRGKLYVLYDRADLFAYDIAGVKEEETLPVTVVHCINGADTTALPPGLQDSGTGRERYCYSSSSRLVVAESANGGCGELLMVCRRFCTTFNVLVADLDASWWTEAAGSGLEDQLLFVSASCSKAVRASRYGGGGAMRGGRMFITNDYSRRLVLPDFYGKYDRMDEGFGVYELCTGVFDHKLLPDGACDRCCHFPGNLFFPSFLSYYSR